MLELGEHADIYSGGFKHGDVVEVGFSSLSSEYHVFILGEFAHLADGGVFAADFDDVVGVVG